MEGPRCEIPTGFSRKGGRIPIPAEGMCGRGAQRGGEGLGGGTRVPCDVI